MKIVCDIDGVLADWNTAAAKLLMKINPSIKLDYMDPGFPAIWNWDKAAFTKDDCNRMWAEIKGSGMFWQGLFPYATTLDDLDLLYSLRKEHDIYFLTARPGKTAKQETEFWLKAHGYPNATVVICDGHKKNDFCTAIEANMLIEDKPENLEHQWQPMTKVLFKRPYNKGYWGYFDKTVESVREALSDVH